MTLGLAQRCRCLERIDHISTYTPPITTTLWKLLRFLFDFLPPSARMGDPMTLLNMRWNHPPRVSTLDFEGAIREQKRNQHYFHFFNILCAHEPLCAVHFSTTLNVTHNSDWQPQNGKPRRRLRASHNPATVLGADTLSTIRPPATNPRTSSLSARVRHPLFPLTATFDVYNQESVGP